MFQYAFARAYAERIGAELQTDAWWGQKVFGFSDPPIEKELPQRADMDFETWDGETAIEITGWCLHQKCLIYTRKQAREWFTLTKRIAQDVEFVPTHHVAYHVRWGDFQTDPAFIAISHKSYDKAFQQFLGTLTELPRMVCAWEPYRSTRLENLGLGWLPDFIALTRAQHLFRANSTFSWWAAALSHATIYSPKLDGITPEALKFQDVPFVLGNHPAISCFHPNCSDLYLPE